MFEQSVADPDGARPDLRFGGYKESGFGREGGMHGLHAYVRLEDR